MKPSVKTTLLYPAVAGAVYAALTALLAPISYGPVQFRVSEALCILPFFCPPTAVGLALGCAIANTLSAAGLLDIVFGSLATLLAGLCTAATGRRWRGSGRLPTMRERIFACLMPVVWNTVIVGAVLAHAFTPDAFWQGFWLNAAQVGLGEGLVMFLAGFPLIRLLARAFPFLGQNS